LAVYLCLAAIRRTIKHFKDFC